jgi:hypothetical protein
MELQHQRSGTVVSDRDAGQMDISVSDGDRGSPALVAGRAAPFVNSVPPAHPMDRWLTNGVASS